jgi:preprotein translocase subunit YajC
LRSANVCKWLQGRYIPALEALATYGLEYAVMISPAFAQTAAATGSPMDALGPLIPFVLIAVVFYFLLIRPQQKRLKEHRAMIDAVAKGDIVVTAGGLIGKVIKVEDMEVQIDLGEGTIVRVVRSTLADVKGKAEAATASVAASKPKAVAAKKTTAKK